MEDIKTKLRTLITNSKKPKSARDDLEYEILVVRFVISGVLERPNYRGTSPEKEQIKQLVAEAEAIDPPQAVAELESLVKELSGLKNPPRNTSTKKAGRRIRKNQKYSRRR